MTAFRVDPAELADLARDQPFTRLAASARSVAVPASSSTKSPAIERFKHRLGAPLSDLATATGSLGRATRSAAAGYREVEASISRTAGG